MNNIIVFLQKCCDSYSRGEYYVITQEDSTLLSDFGISVSSGAEVSDVLYDKIYFRAKELYPTDQFFNNVTTSDAGYGKEVDLSMWPAGSMEELKEGEFNKWKKSVVYQVSAKLDGCSGILFYKNGKLEVASTRGDGFKGFDITRHIMQTRVPKELADSNETTIIRGEFIIPRDKWAACKEELVKATGKSFANARNTVAGFLNSKTTNNIIAKYIDFLAYAQNVNMSDEMIFYNLQGYGFEVPAHRIYESSELNEDVLKGLIKELKETYNYECDGVIITMDDHTLAPGYEEGTINPKCSRKYKVGMADEAKETTVTKVIWSISKDGYLNPIIEVEPIELDGVTVTNCTVNNFATVQKLGVGKGAIVKIRRAGMVIPFLEEVVKPTSPDEPSLPYRLTETGVDAIYDGDDSGILKEIALQKLVFATKSLEIDMAGEGNLRKISDYYYNETDTFMDFIELCRCSESTLVSIIGKNGKKLHKSLSDKISHVSEPDLFAALGTFGRLFGKTKLTKVYEEFGTLNVSASKLITLEGFGATSSLYETHIKEYEEIKARIQQMGKITIADKPKILQKSSRFAGIFACFTGVRSQEVSQAIQENGGIASDNWTKQTNLLIAKDTSSSSGKAKKARERGIEIISLEEAKERFLTNKSESL